MNLKQLKEAVDFHITECIDPEDIPVLITLHQASMGPRAASEVRHAGTGIDWEHGQFRLEPGDALCRLGKSYQDGMLIRVTECLGRKNYFCPRCHERVKKKDHFCSACGQSIILIEVE